MTSRVTPKQCSLRAAVGERERCPGAACAYWDVRVGGTEPNCTIERLRIPIEVSALARHLLDLRLRLEDVRAETERREAPRRYAELLNLNRE
jgi:hypothetical protein